MATKWDRKIAAAKDDGQVSFALGDRLLEVRYMAREGDRPGDTPAWEVNSFLAYRLMSTAWPRDDDALIEYLNAQRKGKPVMATNPAATITLTRAEHEALVLALDSVAGYVQDMRDAGESVEEFDAGVDALASAYDRAVEGLKG